MRCEFILAAVLVSSQLGCNYDCGDDECLFNRHEWELVETLSPLPEPPADLTNKYRDDPDAAALGQKLFFETRYAGKIKVPTSGTNGGLGMEGEIGKVSCASCHIPQSYFMDTRTNPNNMSLGVAYTLRNAPSLVNTVYYDWHGWTGRQDSLWNQSSTSPESADNTGGDRCDYARMLFQHYRAEYDAIFDPDLPAELADTSTVAPRFPAKCKPKSNSMSPDGPWEKMAGEDRKVVLQIMASYAKAIAAYETRLVSRETDFDRYVAGDREAISPAAKRGLKLFVGKAACMDCHRGPFFTDQKFHNIGVPQAGVNVPREDLGRFADLERLIKHPLNSLSEFVDGPSRIDISGLEAKETDKGLFRTPSLRGVGQSPPYFHTGGAATLSDVVWFYNEGGGASGYSGVKDVRLLPLHLSSTEIADLVAFLESLNCGPVPEEMMKNPLATN